MPKRKKTNWRPTQEQLDKWNTNRRIAYKNDPDQKRLKAGRIYHQNNPRTPLQLASAAEVIKRRRDKDPEAKMLITVKARAKKWDLPFNLDKEDMKIPSRCPVLGMKLLKGGMKNNSPSVDKVIPHKGYVKGNVVVISMRANRLKNNATFAELQKIYMFYKKFLNK